MWNKIFKKKQSKTSNKSQPGATTTKCFSFRNGRKSLNSADGTYRYMLNNENFPNLQYESEIYLKPDFNADNYSHLYQPEQHQQHHLDENQQINEIFIEIPPPNMRLDLCPVCSRRFAPETLLKHILICERISTKKRKPFDSSRQRLKGTEFIASTSASVESPSTRISPPKILQRKASETSLKSQPTMSHDQRNNYDVMSRKSSTVSLSTSVSRPAIKRTTSQPTPEKCPYCERVFGFKAYDRHVEWCKEKSLIKPNPDPKAVSIAKERLKTRISYKAPNLKTKRGATREKYSNSCNGSTNSLAEFDSTLNSMSSSITSENGGYDPFMNAKKQLAELFSPTTPTTQMINSMIIPNTNSTKNNNINGSKNNTDIMSKSLFAPKTPQPIQKTQSNFRRTSSLRISNRKPKPSSVYSPPVQSNVHCGITDEGPISPNFVKATDYDELPIKSPYSAIKLCEKLQPSQSSVVSSPSKTLPTVHNNNMINTPIMRDKGSTMVRKNLKLDLKNVHGPSSDYPLSKTDSLALFLKYENELKAELSEKERKDKSNSLSKRSATLSSNFILKDQKLPDIYDINGKHQKMQNNDSSRNERVKEEKEMITIDKIKTCVNQKLNEKDENLGDNNHSTSLKLINACDNLPLLSKNSDKSRSPSLDSRESPEKIMTPTSSRRSGSALRRQMKYNIDNILFDTDPSTTSASVNNENNNINSILRSESRISNTESIFEDFDFDQFIASFTDDEKFPIFKDYKMLLNKSVKTDEENNTIKDISKKSNENLNVSKPITIQQTSQQQQKQYNQKTESELTGMDKLDNLCKMLTGNSDSDDSNTDPSELQTIRSKSSADSAYGSLSRQSQSPLEHRKIQSAAKHSIQHQLIPPPIPQRKHLELKTTEIVLNPIKQQNFQENMFSRDNNSTLNRLSSNEEQSDNAKLSKFCHMCGYKFVVATAKFCIECGVRRIKV